MKKNILFIITLVSIIILSFYGCVKYYTKEATKAKTFCESLIPHLEEFKQKHGYYPSKINTNWFKGQKLPQLIHLDDFYSRINSNLYFLIYRNPIIFQDNVFAYESYRKIWLQYDEN